MFLAAVIKAVDDYADLLRVSVATAGNDHRLGANEAPPAIISMYLGDQLAAVVDQLKSGKGVKYEAGKLIETGVESLPDIEKKTQQTETELPHLHLQVTDLNSVLRVQDSQSQVSISLSMQSFPKHLQKSQINLMVARTFQKMLLNLQSRFSKITKELSSTVTVTVMNGLQRLKREVYIT